MARFVIADDSSIPRDVLRSILAGMGHEVVAVAHNGAQGLQAVRELQPDACIFDISMPVMSGGEAAKQILAEKLCPLVFVASSMAVDAVFAPLKAAGAICTAKPYRRESLEAVIKQWLP